MRLFFVAFPSIAPLARGVLACGIALDLTSCAITPGTQNITGAASNIQAGSAGAPAPLATGTAEGYMYWMILGGGIRKLRLSDGRTPRNHEYGMGGGEGLATDRHGNVYEAFDLDPNGGVAILDKGLRPSRTINLPRSTPPLTVAVDGKDRPYVVCYDYAASSYSIEVFASDASGSATPIRTIIGSRTGLLMPSAIAVDAAGQVYVANRLSGSSGVNDIETFAPLAKGNQSPIRVIQGDATGLTDPGNIALGADGNIYVANRLSSIGADTYDNLVFPTTATGNVEPLRVLQSGAYGSTVALGVGGEIYLGAGPSEPDRKSKPQYGFAIYAPGASGDQPPIGIVGSKDVGDTYRAILKFPWYQP